VYSRVCPILQHHRHHPRSDADLTAPFGRHRTDDTFRRSVLFRRFAYNAANPQQKLFSGVVGPLRLPSARDIVKSASSGIPVPPELVQVCGPLALDA